MNDMACDDSGTGEQMQIRIGGYGGQGIVLAGMLLGKAASLYDEKQAVFTQAYGPEARGGASNADIIISEHTVDYPYVLHADVLAVLFQEAYRKFLPLLKPDGLLIIEEDLVTVDQTEQGANRVYSLPATRIAKQMGNKLVTNTVLLGYLVGLTNIVSYKAVEQAIKNTVKAKVVDLNMQAFDTGYHRGRKDIDP